MSEIDFQSLLDKHDKSDMARFTRNFVDDLEAAMSAEIEIEADMDWSGVVCLGMGGSGAGGMFLSALAMIQEVYHLWSGITTAYHHGGGQIG